MQISNRTRQLVLFILVGITAVMANLPQAWLDQFSVNRNWLLAILGALVFIGLFLFLKFQFFVLVVLLALGANVPTEMARGLGISTLPLIIAMVAMVGIAAINYVVGLLPTGLETKPKEQSAEGIKALFYAIEKGNLVYAQKVLSMNFDPNLRADNGYTPLMYAAARGDARMCELLLRNGADVDVVSAEGDTAIELALRVGSQEVADILKGVRAEQQATREVTEKAQAA
jgi:hypothetical protein